MNKKCLQRDFCNANIFAIKKSKSDNSITKPYDTFESIGFKFSNVLGYSASFTGVENLVQGLYSYGEQNVNKDFKYQVEMVIILFHLDILNH